MKQKPVQYLTKEYLEECKKMTPEQIIEYLEGFRLLTAFHPEKCKLISLKIEPTLLETFKTKSKLNGVPYQTQIKNLMRQWILEG